MMKLGSLGEKKTNTRKKSTKTTHKFQKFFNKCSHYKHDFYLKQFYLFLLGNRLLVTIYITACTWKFKVSSLFIENILLQACH